MKRSNTHRKNTIINNIGYLMRSRGETKTSLSGKSGITRTTIYKILDGKVDKIHLSTLNRISDIFGISCEAIEHYDIEAIEKKRQIVSLESNKNPVAVPIIPESEFINSINKTVGNLVLEYPLTYYFGNETEVVAIKVESHFCPYYSPSDILIIARCSVLKQGSNRCLSIQGNNTLMLQEESRCTTKDHSQQETIKIGNILEERIW